ncbi:MAG: response regulator [Ignavibacteriaceae bacterium]
MIDSTFRNANILIVDDNKANISILTELLEIKGYINVKSTTDSRLVVSLFKSFNPDLILLDLLMPQLSGYQVMHQLKVLIPSDTYLPILVLTADLAPETKERALSGGATDFLAKPLDLVEVDLRIRNLLETRFLHQHLLNQKQILETMVKERTFELERTNIELLIAKDKAEESNRLKSAFLSNISHEIRTPFNGILGLLSIIQYDDISVNEKETYFKFINQNAWRLMNTITDIVEISQIQTGQIILSPSKINIKHLTYELFNLFKPDADKKELQLTINNGSPDNAEFIISDKLKLRTILSKLIDNAVKYTKTGSIEFGYSLGKENKPAEIKFYVKDTGIGIPRDKYQDCFQQFMQADISHTRPFEGSGLGLSIAKNFVEMQGGKIWVESEEGKGSSFYFTLPYITELEENDLYENPLLSDTANNQLKKLKVLIAEDDDVSEMLMSTAIATICKEVICVRTGNEAVEACRSNADIDLVLMDVRMPGMNGYNATRLIRQFNKDVVIIAQTAYGFSGDREKAIEAGCNDYIAKPFNHLLLLELISKNMKKSITL